MLSHIALTRDAEAPVQIFLCGTGQWETGPDFPADVLTAAAAHGFSGAAGELVYAASSETGLGSVLFGIGGGEDALIVAALSAKLPAGQYQISGRGGLAFEHIVAGWVDGAYQFDTYLSRKASPPQLFVPTGAEGDALLREAIAVAGLRDMVNTPAQDMGPQAIEDRISELAAQYDAEVEAIIGDDLLAQGFPMVHAVGRAGFQPPRIVRLMWGKPSDPELAIVGKGVSFDTGGLNLKTGNYMRLMKKDMGGAALAIALAELVMGAALPVRLCLYIPAVENAVSGDAFRPGDILESRHGLSVEIDNTDAEGRLILADALTWASETSPELLLDFATLTGAARVALGPDVVPYFTDDDALSDAISDGGDISGDPVWRMPLWEPYLKLLKSPIADLVNSAAGGMAGAITAAMFLKQFVSVTSWVHFDTWCWRPSKYGRPEGAAACGLRASWAMLKSRYG
ncbi:MAG: leucyl aminopeptidase [Hyphomonadaceae bacterium]|nr:leucyl aminopeptidase [Hyphomonadaceae bacterium]OUX95861.1 MAG: leucyl aminopeptidase [Hyphomonas sp. TMED17]